MKYFDNIINNMVTMHKDKNTPYSSTHMFESQNELSFAISRLMDAQRVFEDEYFDNKEITMDMRTLWFKIKNEMPSDTAKALAICFIQNTPFSNSKEKTDEIQKSFYKTMFAYTKDTPLTEAFIEIFFGEPESQMPTMRDR